MSSKFLKIIKWKLNEGAKMIINNGNELINVCALWVGCALKYMIGADLKQLKVSKLYKNIN